MEPPHRGDGLVPRDPLHLVHFVNSLQRGGVEEYILTLLRGLDRQRFRQSWICPPSLVPLVRADVPADVDLIPLLLSSPRQVRAAAALAGILRRLKPRILHSHLFYASLFASPVGRACGVPVVMETPHIRECWRHGWKSSYAIDRMVARTVDQYVAVSAANARYLVEVKGIPAGKIEVIHFGSDLSRFDPGRPAPAGLRRELGFGEKDLVLLAAARLEPQKGHAVLLEALARIRQAHPNVRLVCVGDGTLRGPLEDQVRAEGLDGAVRFAGFQRNIPEWLAMADMLVLPSFFEGLPLVAIESLAAGKPVVATAVDGTPEVVRDGESGFLVPPGDSAALAAAIGRLAESAELRSRFGTAGRAWVLDHFQVGRFLRDSEELYLRTWERKRKGRD